MKNTKTINAALLIIGNEILSGRTIDQNLNFLARNLTEIGINLCEVRVVGDFEDEIIDAVNILRKKFDYVFTSGGIGPTHDDITTQAIAKALGDKLEKNEIAMEILRKHYGNNLNEAKIKMAILPSKSTLLDNPISSAPGFRIENIFVMAGIPKIFQVMFEAAKKELIVGTKIISKEIKTNLTESLVAKDFFDLQKRYPQISMGSYPFDGGTSLVFRSIDEKAIDEALEAMNIIINQKNK